MTAPPIGPAPATTGRAPFRVVLRRFGFRRPVPPLLIVLGVLATVLLAPAILPGRPLDQHLTEALRGPSAHAWLGTDEFGRDVLARLAGAAAAASPSPGRVSDARGGPPDRSGRELVASNGRVHDVLLETTRRAHER